MVEITSNVCFCLLFQNIIQIQLTSSYFPPKAEITKKALSYFEEGYACSQSVLLTFAEHYNLDENTAILLSSTFGGGMGRLREKCGALTGAFMVIGLAYGNKVPSDMETKLNAYKKVKQLNNIIENIYGTTQCGELLKKHATKSQIEERKHHRIICRNVIRDTIEALYDMVTIDKNNSIPDTSYRETAG